MDNPAFQTDDPRPLPKHHPRKQLTRANSTLTPTTRSWHLTQAPRSKLCRCNSVLDPQACCDTLPDAPAPASASLDYPFFANKTSSSAKNILSDGSLWTKGFWSADPYNRLQDSPKFAASPAGVSAIYDPQFLSSKFGYGGSPRPQETKKEWWPGPGGWRVRGVGRRQVTAALCAVLLTALALANVFYILQTVEKPFEKSNKKWVDVILINGEFRITNEPYRESLANHSSEDFQRLSSLIAQKLDSLFSLSVVSEPYHSTAVTSLSASPSLTVRSQLVLRAASHLTATKVGLAFLGGLRNLHGHVWLANFSIDIQSIGFQASTDAVTWSDWSGWGACQDTVEFGRVQVRSRNCTLRSGQYLYNTLPCLLVPHSHGNIETVPCVDEPLHTAESALSQRIVAADVKVARTDCQNTTDATTTSSTTEQPVTNISVTTPCSCVEVQVCVSLEGQAPPSCRPAIDPSDPTGCGGLCKINTQLCKKIQDNAYRCVDDTTCLEDEWQCGNKLCIPQSKRCDGHFNCYDHTDEQNCDCNLTSHFQCGKRMSCLPLNKRCDAIVDCWDAADELNCTIHCVGVDQFTCNDSQCIPNHRFCDGFADCNDHSDEPFGCGGECKTHEWKCSNLRCIPQSKRCDEVDDCGDTSDEENCPIVKTVTV